MITTISIILAYILGSIPSSVWLGKLVKGIDVRDHGSGNAGATNSFRVLGAGVAIPVLVIDILKGFFATQLVYLHYLSPAFESMGLEAKLLLGIAAVAGHIFPFLAGFRGGKGIATFFGVVIGVHPASALISLALFLLIVLITRYVSLGSVIGAILYPIQIIWIFNIAETFVVIFSLLIPVIVVVTHLKNIQRLLNGQENKLNFEKK